ncbi:MAG TPA: hypothetical protein VFQ39_11935, partial [Longimicrobium sp.]|nr:hypothetical protein [Longimicrobium sp.]
MSTGLSPDRSSRALRVLLPAAALLSLAALAACADQPTAPAASPEAVTLATPPSDGAVFHRNGSGGGYWLHRNRDRHRDREHRHHYRGRNDWADVEAVAVLGPNGITKLTATTGDLDDSTVIGRGIITRLQVKVNPEACHGRSRSGRYTRHSEGDGCGCGRTFNYERLDERTETVSVPGLSRGDSILVIATVRDGRRIDHVQLWVEVVLPPALKVDLVVPPKVVVGAPTVVSATVTETNGDMGAGGTCKLYVDGVLVDQATGISVDAGETVTCAFTYTPTHTGPQNLEVRVGGSSGTGGTTVTANDVATVDVVSPVATTFAASAEDRSVATTTRLEYHWEKPDGSHKEYDKSETYTDRTQTIAVTGTLTRGALFPLGSVSLSFESGGVVWHAEAWSALAGILDGDGNTCNNQQMTDQGAIFYICATPLGVTTFGYSRFGGTVTYHATGYQNTFDSVSGAGDYFTFNDNYTTYASGGQMRPWGSDVKVTIRVTDPLGTFTVAPVVPLTSFDSTTPAPRSCELIYHYW